MLPVFCSKSRFSRQMIDCCVGHFIVKGLLLRLSTFHLRSFLKERKTSEMKHYRDTQLGSGFYTNAFK